MDLICWKWFDMSVARTSSMTSARNSLLTVEGENKKRRRLNQLYRHSSDLQMKVYLLRNLRCRPIDVRTLALVFRYIHTEL